jgi:2-polyprenyl-3-methyl-5-hydroxy-6-metoxy-1,4-benzoquinol methylase
MKPGSAVTNEEDSIFAKLFALMNKPELNTLSMDSLYSTLWDDEHISKGMLEAHLNPDLDAATRNHAFLDKSVRWIAELAPPQQYAKLLDLGCGPGLYAERFAKAGYSVAGIDFSKRSIEYAKEQTELNGSGIDYYCQDYLTIDYTQQFDVVALIFCDYAVLSITDRLTLLKKVYQSLKPNGKFIFDVFTPKMRQKEARSWQFCENGGFFSEKCHLLLEAVYQYDDNDKTELRQHIVVTDEDVNCYIVQDHFFTKELLISEIQPIGFNMFEFYGDVAGKEYSDMGEIICGVFTKPFC